MDVILLYHDGDGEYYVFNFHGVFRTNHLNAQERYFPGFGLFKERQSNDRNIDANGETGVESDTETDYSELSSYNVTSSPNSSNNPTDLTYILSHPIRHGETDEENTGDED